MIHLPLANGGVIYVPATNITSVRRPVEQANSFCYVKAMGLDEAVVARPAQEVAQAVASALAPSSVIGAALILLTVVAAIAIVATSVALVIS